MESGEYRLCMQRIHPLRLKGLKGVNLRLNVFDGGDTKGSLFINNTPAQVVFEKNIGLTFAGNREKKFTTSLILKCINLSTS